MKTSKKNQPRTENELRTLRHVHQLLALHSESEELWKNLLALVRRGFPTPEQAKHAKGSTDFPGLSFSSRKPVLDTTAAYEDLFGRFPVVQSIFEPGPGYFVSSLPRGANSWYPTWDQRYSLPPDTLDQVAYGGLSSGLSSEAGLALNDAIFAIRLDTN